ncbi:MAG: hypothetical protein EBZ49_01155 [Proteobacteria bacterium]|nr:hypothetical protein [Pseudomonadota bacterium]
MPKPQLSLDDHYENDFGFSAVSEDDLKELERRLQQEVIQKEKQLNLTSKEYKERLEALYKLIMPLLINLKKDDSKSYIFWPNRTQKLTEMINKIDNLMDQ